MTYGALTGRDARPVFRRTVRPPAFAARQFCPVLIQSLSADRQISSASARLHDGGAASTNGHSFCVRT